MSRHLDDVLTRYNQLQMLRHRVEAELRDLSKEIDQLLGIPPRRRGRPRKPITLPQAELRELHRRYSLGERTEEVLDGERQYNRANYLRRLDKKSGAR